MKALEDRVKRAARRLAGLVDAWSAEILPRKALDFERIFNSIYYRADWGANPNGLGASGPGSTVETTTRYRAFIESLIREERVRSVVDAGCGDWTFSRHIDWGGASYLGIDASSEVINRVSKSFAGPNVAFRAGDITQELPPADMLIVKDVLQHIPNRYVQQFIRNNLQAGRYRLAVITNDRGPDARNNYDIRAGDFRYLDLTRRPFSLSFDQEQALFDEAAPQKIVQILRFPGERR